MTDAHNGRGNTTRRQHHVWRSYLEAWATSGKIFCLQDRRVFHTNTSNTALQRDFYKLRDLTDADIFFIRRMMKDLSPSAMRVLENFITMFALPGRLRAVIQVGGDADLLADVERQIIVAEENVHAQLEGKIAPIIDSIRRKDLGFYQDLNLCGQFAHFVSLQNLRTKGVQARIFAQAQEVHGMSLERAWNVLRQMMAVNAGCSLMLERKARPLKLLENDTGVPFITGDQPVVNLLSLGTGEPPRLLAFYYPVSPQLAVILDEVTERTTYEAGPVSVEQVLALNRRIRAASHAQVFGSSRDALE